MFKRYGVATTGTGALVEAGVGVSPGKFIGGVSGVVEGSDTDGAASVAGALTVPTAPGCGQTPGGAL